MYLIVGLKNLIVLNANEYSSQLQVSSSNFKSMEKINIYKNYSYFFLSQRNYQK